MAIIAMSTGGLIVVSCIAVLGLLFWLMKGLRNMAATGRFGRTTPLLDPLGDPDAIPKESIGESVISEHISESLSFNSGLSEPTFKTLRAVAKKENAERCTLKIRFVFLNTTSKQISIEDIHNRLYECKIVWHAPLTLGYHSEVKLLQDNTILKESRSYSLEPGDGYEIDLVFQLTRGDNEPTRHLFGLLVDYYTVEPSGRIDRKTMTSDCIYMMKCRSTHTFGPNAEFELTAIDQSFIEELKSRHENESGMLEYINQIESILKDHLAFRPIPKTS
jgi:hypothetical protein